jgi:hypothetical protein
MAVTIPASRALFTGPRWNDGTGFQQVWNGLTIASAACRDFILPWSRSIFRFGSFREAVFMDVLNIGFAVFPIPFRALA